MDWPAPNRNFRRKKGSKLGERREKEGKEARILGTRRFSGETQEIFEHKNTKNKEGRQKPGQNVVTTRGGKKKKNSISQVGDSRHRHGAERGNKDGHIWPFRGIAGRSDVY